MRLATCILGAHDYGAEHASPDVVSAAPGRVLACHVVIPNLPLRMRNPF